MAAGVKITGNFVTNDPQDTYALLEDKYLLGGYRVVDDIQARNDIPSDRRKWGMLVGVVADNKVYQLVDQGNNDLANNTNWIEFSAGGGVAGTYEPITYDELVNKKNNGELNPGQFYGITDYHVNNRTYYNGDEYYTSPDTTIVVQAITNDTLGVDAIELENPTDKLTYVLDRLVEVQVNTYKVNPSNGNVISEFTRINATFENYDYTPPYSKIEYLDDYTVQFGSEVKLIDSSNVRVYRNNRYTDYFRIDDTSIFEWDESNKTLSIVSSQRSTYSFKYSYNSSTYYNIYITKIFFYDKENPRGKILKRVISENNIEADFDVRNVRYRIFEATPQNLESSNATHLQYPIMLPQNALYTTNIDGQSVGYVYDSSTNGSQLVPVFTLPNKQLQNIKIIGSRYIHSGQGNVMINVEISNSFALLFYCSVSDTKFDQTHYFTFTGGLRRSEFVNGFRLFSFSNIDTCKIYDLGASVLEGIMDYTTLQSDFSGWWLGNNAVVSHSEVQGLLEDFKLAKGKRFKNNFIDARDECYGINIYDDVSDSHFSFAYYEDLNIHQKISNSNITFTKDSSNNEFSGEITNSNITIDTGNTIELNDVIESNIYIPNDISGSIYDISKGTHFTSTNLTTLSFSHIIEVDTSSGSVNIELPKAPYNQLELTVIDSTGNASTNNIVIRVNDNPVSGVINTINGSSDNKVINKNYGLVTFKYSIHAGWYIVHETVVQTDADNITIGYTSNNEFTIKNIDHIIDDDNQSIDGSNTPSTDPHKELVTKAYVQTYDLTKKPVRLLANTQSITPNGNQNIDGVDVADGDRVALFGNGDGTDGFYIVNTAGNWERTDDLPVGYNASGVQFAVLEGNTKSNTVWQISDPPGSDVVGTNDLHLIELASMHNIHWIKDNSPTGFGQELYPADSHVKRIEVKNNERGFNEIYLENNNSSDNYTGASITLTVDSANYTNQTFIAHHGSNYYLPQLRSRGAIMTDSSMYIGAYNTTDQQGQPSFVAFVVGDDYHNQKEIFRLTTRGLEMPLADKKIWYEAAKTTQNHPSEYTQLFCNVATSEIYAGIPMVLGPVRVVSTTNITLNNIQTIDGVALNGGDRVLVAGQSDAKENGIYIAKENADWIRAGDLPDGSTCAGKTVVVQEGTQYADSLWEFSSDTGNDVIGTNEIYLKLLSGGVATPITDVFNITASDVANGYVMLTHTIDTTQHDFVFLNGLLLEPTIEYTITGNQVNFTTEASIEAGDKVIVKYYI